MERLLDRMRAQSNDLGTKLRLSRFRRHEHTGQAQPRTRPQSESKAHSILSEHTGQAETTHSNPHTIHEALQYDPLYRDRTIRVVDLAPGTWDEPVTCSLRTVHVDDDDTRYEAISYAWGDLNDRKTVVCNGHVVSTTRSLFEALQRFRCADTTRTLWADELCINQADNEERTMQVQRTVFIYASAVRVLVWLQHGDDQVVRDSLDAICQFVCKENGFSRFGYPVIQRHVLYQWRGAAVTSVSSEYSPVNDSAAMDALRRICASTWFTRRPVVHEVALSTSVFMFWGHARIAFDWLGIASMCYLVKFGNTGDNILHCYDLFQLSYSDPNVP